MAGATEQAIRWQLELKQNITTVLETVKDAFDATSAALSSAEDAFEEALSKGRTTAEAYSEMLRKALENLMKYDQTAGYLLSQVLKDVSGEAKAVINILAQVSGYDLTPVSNFAKLTEDFERNAIEWNRLGEVQAERFWLRFRASSIPEIKRAAGVIASLPKEAQPEMIQFMEKIVKAFKFDQIREGFWESLSDPDGLKFWMKQASKFVKQSSSSQEFAKQMAEVWDKAMTKRFWPSFARHGSKSMGVLSKIWGSKMGSYLSTALSTSIGFALADTTKIVTSAVTTILDPLLETLSYLVTVSVYPLQTALLTLFEEVRPALMDLSAILGRIVYGILPVFQIGLKVLHPALIIIVRTFGLLEKVISPVLKLFGWVVQLLNGQLIPESSLLSRVLSRTIEKLSWLGVVFDYLGWVLSVILIPIMIHYGWVMTVWIYKTTMSAIAASGEMVRALIVSAARWAADRAIISANTLAVIENASVRRWWSVFTWRNMWGAIKRIWELLVWEKWEYIKNAFVLMKNAVARRLWAREIQLGTAALGENALAMKVNSLQASKATKALGLLGGGVLALTVLFSDWSDPISVVSNLLLLLGSVILPLLTVSIKNASVAQWLWTGALAAFNAVLNMSPLGWVITAIAVLVSLVAYLIYKFYGPGPGLIPGLQRVGELFGWVFQAAFAPIKFVINLVSALVDILRSLVGWVFQAAFASIKFVINLVSALVDILHSLVGWAKSAIEAVGGFVRESFSLVGKLFTWFDTGSRRVKMMLLVAFGPLGMIALSVRWVYKNWAELKQSLVTGLQAVSDALVGLWEGFKGVLVSVWNFIKSWIQRIPRPIRWLLGLGLPELVKPPEVDQSALKRNVAEAGSTIKSEAVKLDVTSQMMIGVSPNTQQQQVSRQAVTNWQQQGQSSGEALARGFAHGQLSKKQLVSSATEGVAEEAGKYLPHSDADKGPLSGLVEAGKAFVTTFASGLQLQKAYLEESIKWMFSNLIGVVPTPMPSVVNPVVRVDTVNFSMEPFTSPAKFSAPIVAAINEQTQKLMEFVSETFNMSKDLDISDLDTLSRFS